MLNRLLNQGDPPDASRSLERAHDMCVREIHATFEGTILALGLALEFRDFETKGHTERVVAWSTHLAESFEMDVPMQRAVRWGAYLHDIGKLAVSDDILLKPGRLDAEEWDFMKAHADLGDQMLKQVPALPDETRAMIRWHHERWDGSGYPDGLGGEAIPLPARIFALIDVYDALTNRRPYKEAWSREEARAEIAYASGTQFDPDLAQRFLAIEERVARKEIPV